MGGIASVQTTLSQLTLGLTLKDEATFQHFYPGKNIEIVTKLKQTALGQGEKMIYICGTRGEGRTHLLQASCHYAHQHQCTSVYLPLTQLITMSPELLNDLETLDLICIDDIQAAARLPLWEEAIFHLYNRVYDAGGRMIVAGNDLPKATPFLLPDLVSRLTWGVIYQLAPLSDEDKLTALVTRAHQRGISLSEEVGKYMMTHCRRQMGHLFAALDALDKASLAAQRRLTVPFVKEVLQI